MYSKAFAALFLYLVAHVTCQPARVHRAVAFAKRSPDVVTEHYLPLKKSNGTTPTTYRKEKLRGDIPDNVYLIEVTIDGEKLEMILNLGNTADTWVYQKGVECVDSDSIGGCNFGPTFNGTFDEGQIPNENFNATIIPPLWVNGVLGYSDLSFAGLKVHKQEIGLVRKSHYPGDGTFSGTLSLAAYKSDVRAFPGTDYATDKYDNIIEYDPLFLTMIKQKLVAPLFSVAIMRNTTSGPVNPHGGYVAFGGLPPVVFDPVFGSAPIEIVEEYGVNQTATQYSQYTITPTAFAYNGTKTTKASRFPLIVDPGTAFIVLKTALAAEVNALFDPPAVWNPAQQSYFVNCSATAPAFAVDIGGHSFPVDAADMMYPQYVLPDPTLCASAIFDGDRGGFYGKSYVLGSPFLKNVVAVFDVGAGEMRFARHEY